MAIDPAIKQYEKALKQHEKLIRSGLQALFDDYLSHIDYEKSMNAPLETTIKYYWQRLLNQ